MYPSVLRDFFTIICFVLPLHSESTKATHYFTPLRSHVAWSPDSLPSFNFGAEDKIRTVRSHGVLRAGNGPYGGSANVMQPDSLSVDGDSESHVLRIMHITDSHVSRNDEDPTHTGRMFGAMKNTVDFATKRRTHPWDELQGVFRKAREENVDLIALGGDIVNYPSRADVAWVLEQLQEAAGGIPFIYTAGNHDWHLEYVNEARYDSSRLAMLNTTLRPLFERSAVGLESGVVGAGSGAGLLYGHIKKKGVDIIFLDNSNYQIDDEQLAFARSHLEVNRAERGPLLVLLHMPLMLPGLTLQPKEVCGHPEWGGDADPLADIEGRPRWPQEGNLPSTNAFIKLVQTHAAPTGRIIALLTGHVHHDFTAQLEADTHQKMLNLTSLVCGERREGCGIGNVDLLSGGVVPLDEPLHADGALQYTTLDAAEGGYRILTIRRSTGDDAVVNDVE